MKNINKTLKTQTSEPMEGIAEEEAEPVEDEEQDPGLSEFINPKKGAEATQNSSVVQGAPPKKKSILDDKTLLKDIEYQKVNIH